jgi:hypothetical protein
LLAEDPLADGTRKCPSAYVRYRTDLRATLIIRSIESATRTDEAMYEQEITPRFRSGKVVYIGRATLTPTETTELRRLFDLVSDTCDAASQLLATAQPTPVGSQLERVRDLGARAQAMVERLKSILE